MRTTVALMATAAVALTASPALAADSYSFSPRYGGSYTSWGATSSTFVKMHQEAANRSGAVHAQVEATGGRPASWNALGAGVVTQSVTVPANSLGYRVEVDFTGIRASATSELPAGNIGSQRAADTSASVGVGVRLVGECTTAVPCDVQRYVVKGSHDIVTVAYEYPAVSKRATLIVDAHAQAWVRTPVADGQADSASVSATVSAIRVAPRTS